MSFTRRRFAATGAITALSYSRLLGANDRIHVGFIGVGNRGDQVLDAFLKHSDCQITAVCDIYQPYVDFAANKAAAAGSPGAKGLKDYRRLLELKDVDAVAIATPDHWHALQTVHACEAGKDVYVEKPLSLTVVEGRKMVEAAQRHQRVTQVGLQRHSSDFCKEAAEIVRRGGIGKVTRVRCFHVQNEWPKGIGHPPDEPPPNNLDWEAWLGPAPKRPYNKNRTFYRFRWFFDYSGGQLTNFGVHYLDIIHWALGQDSPQSVAAMGGKLAGIEDNREIPDTLEVLWMYPGGTLVSFSQYNASAPAAALNGAEIEFRGTQGTLFLRGNGYQIVPDSITLNEFPARTPVDRNVERGWRAGAKTQIEARQVQGRADTEAHARNFLDCVRSRAACNCAIETGHRSNVPALIGNIAWRTRAFLEWDGKAERFTNHSEANRYLSYKYREPYKLS
jgi:predicted dehydrogenase